MNPLSTGILSALFLRFAYVDRRPIDGAWARMVERYGDHTLAKQRVDEIIVGALDQLPEGAPKDLWGKAVHGAVEAIIEEWAPQVHTGSDEEQGTENALLQHLVAAFRARTSDSLTDENEQEWWAILVKRYGPRIAAERIEQAMSLGVVQAQTSPDVADLEQEQVAMRCGHEAIRAIFRLVDAAKIVVQEKH